MAEQTATPVSHTKASGPPRAFGGPITPLQDVRREIGRSAWHRRIVAESSLWDRFRRDPCRRMDRERCHMRLVRIAKVARASRGRVVATRHYVARPSRPCLGLPHAATDRSSALFHRDDTGTSRPSFTGLSRPSDFVRLGSTPECAESPVETRRTAPRACRRCAASKGGVLCP